MERPLNETASTLERLAEQVGQLERRVQALEHRVAQSPASADRPSVSPPVLPAIEPASSPATGLTQVFGTAVLGFGGAYLLRAASESGALPGLAGVAAAVIYVAVWLAVAARERSHNAAGAVYAATAALILSPMLWETAVRFKILPAWAAALLLLGFAIAGAAIASVHGQPALLYATLIPSPVAAVVLAVATGELIPFLMVLLALGALAETGASRNRWLLARPCAALAADFGVWLSLRIATQPHIDAYQPVAWQAALGFAFALLGNYSASIVFRTIWRAHPVTVFEILQLTVAYSLAVSGAMRLTQATAAVGAGCLLIAAASYYAGFRRFGRDGAARNHLFYAYQGLLFALIGGALLLSGWFAAGLGSVISLAVLFLSRQMASPTLTIHAAVCLAASALVSGLLEFGYRTLTGADLPELSSSVVIVAAAAFAAYFVCSASSTALWPRAAIAVLAVYSVVALFTVGLASLRSGPLPAPWFAAFRTLAASAVILFLGFAGSRWKKHELIWIGHATTALLTLKLFWQDFRQGSPAALAVSLLAYGLILVLGPRLMRWGRR